jgi:hypothetical protein
MSTDDPSANGGSEDSVRARPLGELSDEQLLAALGKVLGVAEPPPPWSLDLAKSSYGLRAVDSELAELVFDSGVGTTASVTRANTAPRLAAFHAADFAVEIEIQPDSRAGTWRLIGQLTPPAPARIQVRRQQAEPVSVTADDLGRFVVGQLPAGPLSLAFLRDGGPATVTEWIGIG